MTPFRMFQAAGLQDSPCSLQPGSSYEVWRWEQDHRGAPNRGTHESHLMLGAVRVTERSALRRKINALRQRGAKCLKELKEGKSG